MKIKNRIRKEVGRGAAAWSVDPLWVILMGKLSPTLREHEFNVIFWDQLWYSLEEKKGEVAYLRFRGE